MESPPESPTGFPAWLALGLATTAAIVMSSCTNTNGGSRPRPGNSSHGAIPSISVGQEGLYASTEPELRRLAAYQQKYNLTANQLMLFADTPLTVEEAAAAAGHMAVRLKAFAANGIHPRVVLEPENIDMRAYANGAYDGALDAYFAGLKTAAIDSKTLGTWVILPEPNIPEWGTPTKDSLSPEIYAKSVNTTAQTIKRHFPDGHVSLLLNSETVEPGDVNWERAGYKSLVPYVESVNDDLIDSVGLQGFPWSAPADQPINQSFKPEVFLNATLLTDAAKALGVHDVWFNTGTFNRMYTGDRTKTVGLTAEQRREMLSGILAQVVVAKERGFTVVVNLFAQNKSAQDEAIDWSYGQSSNDTDALKNFVTNIQQRHVTSSLFDTE